MLSIASRPAACQDLFHEHKALEKSWVSSRPLFVSHYLDTRTDKKNLLSAFTERGEPADGAAESLHDRIPSF